MIQTLAFYLFAIVVLLSGAMTISSRNPVHSVLWLILAFFNAAALFLISDAASYVWGDIIAVNGGSTFGI